MLQTIIMRCRFGTVTILFVLTCWACQMTSVDGGWLFFKKESSRLSPTPCSAFPCCRSLCDCDEVCVGCKCLDTSSSDGYNKFYNKFYRPSKGNKRNENNNTISNWF